MTSRRPMTRSYSGNGRSSSQNGEDVSAPSGRSESRNYLSNVRPENRSTLCTVMAQLTEETQPCFETTIKSKAVSETCNVKFSCVVTGYPAPELTWYKDDMELDRYCGLPKYEIFRNGKIHTLHVYNCTEDDAAIYQASARNSKGIVSCSGVLEVGTMSEYMIHQRFFAKLKQKAENKRRELEESRRRGKENIQKEQLNAINQERLLRKRRIPAGTDLQNLSPTTQDEDGNVPSDGVHEERPVIIDDMSQGSVRATIPSSTETGHHNHVEETSIQQPHEKPDEKKMRIANGFNEESVNHATQSDGEQDDPDDGIALAKYLAESVQQNLSPEQSQEKMEVDGSDGHNKAVETERKRSREEERDRTRVKEKGRERVKEKEKPAQVEQEPKSVSSKSSSHKDQEHHHKSALSSVLHSLKDIFFGKSKKATETADSSRKTSQSSLDKEIQLELPSPNHPEEADFETLTTTVAVEEDVPQHPKGSVELDLKSLQQTASSTTRTEIPSSTEFTASKHEDVSPRPELHLETNGTSPPTLEPQESTELPQKPESESRANDLLQTSPSPNVEIENDNNEPSSSEADCQTPTETLGSTHAPADEVIQGAEEINVLEEKGGSEAHLTDISMADLESMPCCESQPESQLSQQEPHTIAILNESQTVEPVEDENKEGSNSKEKVISLTEEERIAKPQEGDSPTKGIEEKVKDREEEEKIVGNELERESSLPVVVDQKPIIRISPPPVIQQIHERAIDDAMEVDLKAEDRSIAELDVSAKENKDITASAINQNNMDGNVIHGKVLCIEQKDRVEDVVESRNEKTRHDVREEKISEEQSDVPNVPKVSESKKHSIEEAILNVEIEASKSVKKTEIEVLEVIQRPYKVDKAKPLAKGQVERRLADKDQPAVQPIIILPDTRETVIKNVAKKRSTPLIPEIKVTFPDRLKREETIPLPRGDYLKLEPERLAQPQDKQINDAPRALGELIVNNAPVTSEILGVPRSNQAAEERPQDVKAESMEARLQGGEEQGRNSNGRGREEDSTIPTISIACADDNLITGMSSLPGIVISEDVTQPAVPPITVTMDNGISAGKNDSEMVGSEKPKELTPQLGTDLPLPLLTLTPQSPTPDPEKIPQAKDTKAESEASSDRLLRDKPSIEKLGLTAPVGPTLPPLSPASLRRLMAKNNPNLDNQGSVSGAPIDGSEKKGDESGGSTPTSTLSCESSPKMKRRDSLTLIPSATPEELASGARRKIYLAKTKSEDEGSDTQGKRDSPYMSPSQARRAAFLQLQSGQQTPPSERRSPLMARRKATLEVPKPKEESLEVMESAKPESKPAEKEKLDPFKAPQVIRKIRGEPFSDASGHLKLWCQFFNVLSESIIKWYRDEEEILEFKKCAGDESPVALAIVQASGGDCGVYGCSIKNEYGTDITDYLLSADILAEFFLREDLEVGEEIEMTPMMFTKGLADSGYWGEKFFGRIMTEEVQIGEGCGHKTCRAKVIYGLDPVYESGSTCITKVRNPIAYGAKEEGNLSERNLQITRQDCKIQNTVREYCKIFAAEARVIENFGFALEVIPLHLVYRPANTVPYATVETDLKGSFLKYCLTDNTGKMINRSTSEVEQKCCTFQHWIHQWTNGNLLVTRIEGVDTKMTSIEIASKSKGYQGLTEKASPKIMEQFITQHQCNYYCGLLGLRPLKPVDSQQPKIKTSRSPLLARRGMSGSSSPQLQKKGTSPQSGRKGPASPKVVKKPSEAGQSTPTTKHKAVEVPKPVRMR